MGIRRLLPGVFMMLAVLGLASTAFAADPPATTDLSRADHYCIACHSASDARLAAPMAWKGGSEGNALSPCPTVKQLRQEMTYTDDAFDAIRNAAVPDVDQKLIARSESLARLLETPYRSVDAGVNEARTFRYQLNKSYAQVQVARTQWATNTMLIVGIVVTLVLLASLAWGYANTRGTKAGAARWVRFGPWTFLFLLFIFVVFSLPIFNPPVQSETSTAADLERQTALDDATRAAVSAENLSAKAWQLARLAAVAPDKHAAALALTAAFSATRELEVNEDAYWGLARAVEESAVTWDKGPEAAQPVADRILTASARAWAPAAMAEEIAPTDPSRAAQLLDDALDRAKQNPDPYFRALDLKKIAVAWARVNQARATSTAQLISDPFIRAWALRELGQYDAASAAARLVEDPHRRASALREIGAVSKNVALMDESLAAARTLAEPARAHAFSDLAAAWSALDPSHAAMIANQIPRQYPGARARALSSAGRFVGAWEETANLDAGSEKARAQRALVSEWAKVAPSEALAAALKIADPYWSAEAQRAVAAESAEREPERALQIARAIPIPFVRVRAIGQIAAKTRAPSLFQEAAALAEGLHDVYALRDLTIAWAAIEPAQALALVDKMDREVDRAQALLAIALALAPSDRAQANAMFERAIKQAQTARARGDAFAATELLRELSLRYSTIDAALAAKAFSAAIESADKVTTGF